MLLHPLLPLHLLRRNDCWLAAEIETPGVGHHGQQLQRRDDRWLMSEGGCILSAEFDKEEK